MVRPVTLAGLAVVLPVLLTPAAVQVAVYSVMVAPPLEAGAVNAMLALALPAVAAPMVGAPGAVAPGVMGVLLATGFTVTTPEAFDVPALLVALTWQLYKVSLVRPETVIGLAVALADLLDPTAIQVAV